MPGTGKPTTTKCLEADDCFKDTCSTRIQKELDVIHHDTDYAEETGYFISALAIFHLAFVLIRALINCILSLKKKQFTPPVVEDEYAVYQGQKVLARWSGWFYAIEY